ncbi:hypothetical protein H1R20_g12121, partial [Candolleomyces eurysporus]
MIRDHRALAENLLSAASSTLAPTLPLKLVRSSMIKVESCSDDILYPESVLEMMREIDDAIESWEL